MTSPPLRLGLPYPAHAAEDGLPWLLRPAGCHAPPRPGLGALFAGGPVEARR